jgi:hypothetical protein
MIQDVMNVPVRSVGNISVEEKSQPVISVSRRKRMSMSCKYKQYTKERRITKLIFPNDRLVNMGEFIRQENDELKPILCRFCGRPYLIPSHVMRHEKECIKVHGEYHG